MTFIWNGLPTLTFVCFLFNRYMNAAKIEDVLITAQVLKQGRTLAFATVDLTNKANGKLIAQGRHTKHLGSWLIKYMPCNGHETCSLCCIINSSIKIFALLGYVQQCLFQQNHSNNGYIKIKTKTHLPLQRELRISKEGGGKVIFLSLKNGQRWLTDTKSQALQYLVLSERGETNKSVMIQFKLHYEISH